MNKEKTIREIILKLLEEWLDIILRYKKGEIINSSVRDLIAMGKIDQAANEIIELVKEENNKLKFPAHPYNLEDEKKRIKNQTIDLINEGLEKLR